MFQKKIMANIESFFHPDEFQQDKQKQNKA